MKESVNKALNIFIYLLVLTILFSCRKDEEGSVPDFRDKFVGEYEFTKYQGNHSAGYTWEDDGFGNPIEVFVKYDTEDLLWQSTGKVKKTGRKNRLKIEYGNGEKFKVEVSSTGEISCINDNCSDMIDPPTTGNNWSSLSVWSFSWNSNPWVEPASWDDMTYFLNLGSTLPPEGITSYSGWNYQDWKIEGVKL